MWFETLLMVSIEIHEVSFQAGGRVVISRPQAQRHANWPATATNTVAPTSVAIGRPASFRMARGVGIMSLCGKTGQGSSP